MRFAVVFVHAATERTTKANKNNHKPRKDFEIFEHYEIPELRELLSKKALQILLQNIGGFLGKKPRVCQTLDASMNIFFLLTKHTSTEDGAQAQIYRFAFVGRSGTSGQCGSVGACTSSPLSFHRRLDLE